MTANSVYGQTGAVRTSPIGLREIAASCTATGRKNLLFARDYIEKEYGATTVYGDTDSVFMRYPCVNPDGSQMTGMDAVKESWRQMTLASQEVSDRLDAPHCLAPEKVRHCSQHLPLVTRFPHSVPDDIRVVCRR